MTQAEVVHMVVPEGFGNSTRPSGGNIYDLRVCRDLGALGWTVHVHEVPGSWPRPDEASYANLAGAIARIPDGATVLIDGLVASPSPEVLVPAADRLRLAVLIHLPLGHGTTDTRVRERERAVLSAAAAVVTTSAWSRRIVLELHAPREERVHVAEPGVDPARLAPGTPTAGALLSVAAVIPGKGHDVLLDALAALRDLRWACLCIGSVERDPRFVGELRRRVAEDGLHRRVRFTGPFDSAELGRSYRAADLLVVPSRTETYGMVVTEALARGLPVVAAAVGGVPEALGRAADGTLPGLLVAPEDPAALRAALRAWLEDADLRRRLRRAARERRASLTGWSATASVLADVLLTAA